MFLQPSAQLVSTVQPLLSFSMNMLALQASSQLLGGPMLAVVLIVQEVTIVERGLLPTTMLLFVLRRVTFVQLVDPLVQHVLLANKRPTV